MKRSLKAAVFTLAAFASVTAHCVPAHACGGSGGRSYARTSRFVASSYTRPAYSQPVYSQPTYSQPAYHQPTYSQPIYTQPTHVSSPTGYSQPTANYTQPTANFSSQVIQQAPSTSVASSPSSVTTATPAAPRTQVTQRPKTADAQSDALALLVSIASQSKASANNTANQTSANEPRAETASTIPEFSNSATSSTPKAGVHVGTWLAVLPGSQSVKLQLKVDSSFVWTATKQGKSNEFTGQYRISNDRLTLVRSSDLQQMNGTWTANSSGFDYKLDGTTTGGLSFQRN